MNIGKKGKIINPKKRVKKEFDDKCIRVKGL